MKIIEIRSQAELDKLEKKFDQHTIIKLVSGKFVLRLARGNSSVVARGNSSVEAFENSSVVALENSSVEAFENSSVVARENSSVVARGNSSVVARENSSVEAFENSSVVALENSSVEAWENSSVVARENSSVVARGNSSVEAFENSSVVAWGNAVIRVFHQIRKIILKQYSVCLSVGFSAVIKEKSDTSTVVEQPEVKYTKDEFCDIYKKNIQKDGRILLYKTVREDGTDFWTGRIKYEGVVKPEKWDSSPDRQCGDGLHLSPTPQLARSYNNGTIKKCLVRIDDFVAYPHDITKVRCKEVEVLR